MSNSFRNGAGLLTFQDKIFIPISARFHREGVERVQWSKTWSCGRAVFFSIFLTSSHSCSDRQSLTIFRKPSENRVSIENAELTPIKSRLRHQLVYKAVIPGIW